MNLYWSGGRIAADDPNTLLHTSLTLAELVLADKRTTISNALVNRYLADLYAALIQLTFSPNVSETVQSSAEKRINPDGEDLQKPSKALDDIFERFGLIH